MKECKIKDYRVSDQLPRELRARRTALIPKLQEVKDDAGPNAKVSLKGDRILCDGELLDSQFKKNPIRNAPGNPVVQEYDNIIHSAPVIEQGSLFQGHADSICSLRDAQASHDALLQDFDVADGNHITYAYRLRDGSSRLMIVGHSDDGEWTAGGRLASLLQERQADNVFIAVSRKYGGKDLGRRRFVLLRQVASDALDRLGINRDDEPQEAVLDSEDTYREPPSQPEPEASMTY